MPKIFIKIYGEEILDNLPDSFLVYDSKGSITYVNKALVKLFGYQPKELLGRPIIKLIPEKEEVRFLGMLQRIIKEGRFIRDFSTTFIAKDKKEITVDYIGFPLRDPRGKIKWGAGIAVDMRQLKGLLEALGRAKSELEKNVQKRTRELQAKIEELEEFQRLTVGRELKMVELKKEIESLKEELKKPTS